MLEENIKNIEKALMQLSGNYAFYAPNSELKVTRGEQTKEAHLGWYCIRLFEGSTKECLLYWEQGSKENGSSIAGLLELLLDEWIVPLESNVLVRVLTEPYKPEFEETMPPFLKVPQSWRLGAIVVQPEMMDEVNASLKELIPEFHIAKIKKDTSIFFSPASVTRSTEYLESIKSLIADDLVSNFTLVLGLPISGVRYLNSITKVIEQIAHGLYKLNEFGIYNQETLPMESCLSVIGDSNSEESLKYLAGILDCVLTDEDLNLTAKTFLKNHLNVTETAQALYLHRNTLVYRLAKIEKLTGFDLKRFDHAMAYYGLNRIRSWMYK